MTSLSSVANNPNTVLGQLHNAPPRNEHLVLSPKGPGPDYEIQRFLGMGGNGTVYQVSTAAKVGQQFALKIPKSGKRSRESEMFHHVVGSPHALKLVDEFDIDPKTYQKTMRRNIGSEDIHALVTTMYPCANCCQKFILPNISDSTTPLTSAQILSIGDQGLETLQSFRLQGLIHRDIKPENMAYNEATNELVIGDFDLMEEVGKIDFRNLVGTVGYQAPEQLLYLPYGPEVDLWGFAATLFELYTGIPLIPLEQDETPLAQLHLIVQNFGTPTSEFTLSAPSAETRRIMRKIENQAKDTPNVPVWEARIYKAAKKKGESVREALKLIDFLRPMFRYYNRTTQVEELRVNMMQNLVLSTSDNPPNKADMLPSELNSAEVAVVSTEM